MMHKPQQDALARSLQHALTSRYSTPAPPIYGFTAVVVSAPAPERGFALSLANGAPVGFLPFSSLTGSEGPDELWRALRENVRTFEHGGLWQATAEEKQRALELLGEGA